jgi:hypothetical protein
VGKKTKISGQAGAVGKNAHVHDNTFNQVIINQSAPVTYTAWKSLKRLATDLAKHLRFIIPHWFMTNSDTVLRQSLMLKWLC